MNQKGFASIILIAILISIVIAGRYFVFTQQSSVTQTQQPEPTSSQDNSLLQDILDSNSASFIGKWEVVSVQQNGIQIVPEGNGAVIEFFRDGTYKASGGCNEMFVHSYEMQPDSKLSIKAGGTKRKCAEDVVEFWDLNEVYTCKFTDNTLFLHYKRENGVEGFFKLLRVSSY